MKLITKIIGIIKGEDVPLVVVDDEWLSNVAYINNISEANNYLADVWGVKTPPPETLT